MGAMSDKGLDLATLEAMFGEGENLAHWAQRGPSGADREQAVERLNELLEKLAKYAPSRRPTLPTAPDFFHKCDPDEVMEAE